MAQIFGQVESMKKLEDELIYNDIKRFKSITDIEDFLFNFRDEIDTIIKNHKENLNSQINNLPDSIEEKKRKRESIKRQTIAGIEVQIDTLRIDIDSLKTKTNKSIFNKIAYGLKLRKKEKKLEYYSLNTQEIISCAIKNINDAIINEEKKLENYIKNYENIVRERSQPEIQKLNDLKNTIQGLRPLIAGALGENLVVKEIEKLPENYILINDFNLNFNPPIFNRNTNDRIFSIQVDHLLISRSGIYILETKNWSRKSIESYDLRSPVEQITRTSYALFLLINDANIRLAGHHWGEKQIPVKNIIVMINHKPNQDFKYVKVKLLSELNNYLTYFEPIFTDNEVNRIAKYLLEIRN